MRATVPADPALDRRRGHVYNRRLPWGAVRGPEEPRSTISELVDITPDVSLLRKVGQSGHSVAEAVAELVDNAIDARLPDQAVRVDVSYNAREGWIRVDDDGHGMTRQELSRALVLALSGKGDADIGKFGLGMKTACTSLGDRFVITTARAGAHYAAVAEYDEERFAANGEWRLPISRRKKDRPHGTSIEIRSSRVYPALHQSLVRNLGWTFRHFLLDGVLRLRVNEILVEPAADDVDHASILPFEGEVAGRLVRGWVGLLRTSSQRGWYGFALIRRRRIVRRHEKLGFQAHPSTARVVGEIHLDDFDTNNLKTDFIRETAAWRELESWISQTIEPVLAASRALAHAGMVDLRIKTHLEEERRRLLGDEGAEPGLNLPARSRAAAADESQPVAVAVGSLHLEHVFVNGASGDPYLTVERQARAGEADLVTVRTNLGHPGASQVSDRSGWACHNLAETAARELVPDAQFVDLKSIVLGKLLEERGLRRALTESARELLRPRAPTTAISPEPLPLVTAR